MRSARLLFLLLVVILVLSACSPAQTGAPVETPAQVSSGTATPQARWRLRITNAGEYDIQGLVVMFPDARIEFGDIPAGSTTEYLPAPTGVYNYAAYEYLQNGEKMLQPVIDWMGESPRPGADFTYTLNYIADRPNAPSIELVQATVDR